MLRIQPSRLTLTRRDVDEFEEQPRRGRWHQLQDQKEHEQQNYPQLSEIGRDQQLKNAPGFSTRLGFVTTTARPALARTASSSSSRSSEATIYAEGGGDEQAVRNQADDPKNLDTYPSNCASSASQDDITAHIVEKNDIPPIPGPGPLVADRASTSSYAHPEHRINGNHSSALPLSEAVLSPFPCQQRHSKPKLDHGNLHSTLSDANLEKPCDDESPCSTSKELSETGDRHRSWSGTQSTSSFASNSSRSMPNLRNAALSLHRTGNSHGSFAESPRVVGQAAPCRFPSMVSAASGISRLSSSSRGLDAAEEFLMLRNSPLDELAEQFRRLGRATFPRYSTQSSKFQPQTRRRPSLLNGDPFGQYDSSLESDDDLADFLSSPVKVRVPTQTEIRAPFDKPLPDLPSSSSERSPSLSLRTPNRENQVSSPSVPSRSPTSNRSPTGCRSFHPIVSISQSVKTIKAKMMPATPHVHVYNDSKPAEDQPQTPADLLASSRHQTLRDSRLKHDSDDDDYLSPTSRSTKYRPSRHTYPASLAALAYPQSSTPTRGSTLLVTSHLLSSRNGQRRATNAGRASADEENSFDGSRGDLEDERRFWVDRQTQSSLDVTPPKEDRFERFLL